MAANTAHIPVYLLTGYLGSGKTTLLASWLKESELEKTALIVNEAGEVGFDQHLLRGAIESAALVAGACVCCTGLPGLEQALADLFWSRLHRKIDAFDAVFIETTGLADPLPIVQLLQEDSLLRERYRLAGVIATLGATGGELAIARHPEAISQIRAADLVVITKADLAGGAEFDALHAAVAELNPNAALAVSSKASLRAGSMLALLSSSAVADKKGVVSLVPAAHAHQQSLEHGHGALHHDAQALFFPLSRLIERGALAMRLDPWIAKHKAGLLRLKGLVQIDDGAWVTLQWSVGDARADIAPVVPALELSSTARTGLTVIVEKDFYQETRTALISAFK